MVTTHLNRAKLHVPGLTSAPVPRRTLLERLDAHRGRVVLLSAPTGFGKTVVVADWIAGLSIPAAWLSLDGMDEDPVRLGSYLATALAELGDGFEAVAEEIRRAAAGSGRSLGDLQEHLGVLTSDGLLVLDDLHEVESADALRLLEPLVNASGSPLRVVLVTRMDPPVSLTRLRLSGDLLEIRAHDLAFSEEEGAQLMAGIPGVTLAPAQLATLMERTEGWPAGLRLAGIALAEAEDTDRFVSSFAGTHTFVTEHLLEEALGLQPPELQAFLMESAVLPRFDALSCLEILEDPQAGRRLEEARAGSLFLVPLGADGRWYRYHHLFGEILTYRLGRTRPERLEEIRLRASRWFEERGEVEEAIELAALLKDQTLLLELLDRHGLAFLTRSELGSLRRWFDQLDPSTGGPYPLAWSSVAWLRILTERVSDPGPLIRRVEEALAGVGEGYDEKRRALALHQTKILAAYAARYRHDWEAALELAVEAETLAGDRDPLTIGFVSYNTARVLMALGRTKEAEVLLQRSFPDQLRSGNSYLVLATLGRIAATRVQTEGVQGGLDAVETALAFSRDHHLEDNPALSIVHLHAGWTHLLADDIDEAQRAFDLALESAGARDFPEERGNALVGSARVALARGEVARAETLLQEVAALAQAGNVDLFETTLALERLNLAFRRDVWGLAPPAPGLDVFLTHAEAEAGPWTVLREAGTVLALQRALHGSAPEGLVLELSTRLVERSADGERTPARVVGLLARALVDDSPERWDRVEEALQTVASGGYVRPVLELGAALASLLRSAVGQPRLSPGSRQTASGLLERMRSGPQPPGPEEVTGQGQSPTDPGLLTDREQEVLALLQKGMTNKALARTLFVTVDTVKTHLKRIYAKLGVASRSQAVQRARELGLAPDGD